jgi:hypothetical protein
MSLHRFDGKDARALAGITDAEGRLLVQTGTEGRSKRAVGRVAYFAAAKPHLTPACEKCIEE